MWSMTTFVDLAQVIINTYIQKLQIILSPPHTHPYILMYVNQ